MNEAEFVPYNDIEALKAAVTNETGAVILEPVQGEAGVYVADPDYLRAARQICDDAGALLIFDEVQTGFGRTGKWFGKDHSGVQPDIITLAKAIGRRPAHGCHACQRERLGSLPEGRPRIHLCRRCH